MEVSRRVRDWSVFCLLVSDEIGVSEIWHLWHSLKCVICWFFVTIVQTYFTLFFSISTAQRKCRFVFLSLDRGHNGTTHQQCQNPSSSWSHKGRPSSHCLRSFCCKMKKTHTNTLNGFLLSISDTFVVCRAAGQLCSNIQYSWWGRKVHVRLTSGPPLLLLYISDFNLFHFITVSHWV